MLEILLDAVRLITSKDVKEGASSLLSAFSQSPEWKKEICTVEARVSLDEQERLVLLVELFTQKLAELGFAEQSLSDFQVVYRELTQNAVEHGVRRRKENLRVVVELCPAYAALTVHNPGVPVDLSRWLEKGRRHLLESEMGGRGRGLAIVQRKADELVEIGKVGLKAVLYKQRVDIQVFSQAGMHLVVIFRGHSNPSLVRKLEETIGALRGNVALCLDPRDIDHEVGVQFQGLVERASQQYESQFVPSTESKDIEAAIRILERHARAEGLRVRLICTDEDYRGLLPSRIAVTSVAEAVRDLSGDE